MDSAFLTWIKNYKISRTKIKTVRGAKIGPQLSNHKRVQMNQNWAIKFTTKYEPKLTSMKRKFLTCM